MLTVVLLVVDDVIAHVETWSLNDLSLKDLIKMVVKPQTLYKVEIVEFAERIQTERQKEDRNGGAYDGHVQL